MPPPPIDPDIVRVIITNQFFPKNAWFSITLPPVSTFVPTGKSLMGSATLPDPGSRVGHFLCYSVVDEVKSVDKKVSLTDQFVDIPEDPGVMVKKPKFLCNPTDKLHVQAGNFESRKNEDDHLVCYEIDEIVHDEPDVNFNNQFDPLTFTTTVGNAVLLCVPSTKEVTLCGNGDVEGGSLEQCDDGNNDNGDGCDENCIIEFCGNGVEQEGEDCDDGNNDNGDGCDENCIEEECGNGVLQAGAGEECDDGNNDNGDGCDESCIGEFCGDGVTQTGLGEECDDGNKISGDGCDVTCIEEICGDGITHGGLGEQCDDGNDEDGDGCNGNCISEFCGDGVTQTGLGEECDDGNKISGDGCDAACTLEICGDGITHGGLGEQCDDGNNDDEDGCDANCIREFCGDGVVQAGLGEQCDDGNFLIGDGCDMICIIEFCGDSITHIDLGEECDDGNFISGDGCDNCFLEEIEFGLGDHSNEDSDVEIFVSSDNPGGGYIVDENLGIPPENHDSEASAGKSNDEVAGSDYSNPNNDKINYGDYLNTNNSSPSTGCFGVGAGSAQSGGASTGSLAGLTLAWLGMWRFVARPQRKKRKSSRARL